MQRTSLEVPKTRLQGGKDAAVELAEILGAVVDVGAHHRLEGLGQERRGARSEETLLLNMHKIQAKLIEYQTGCHY